MSKYVCEDCGSALSTKYALERHRYTTRCEKIQRDAAKLTLKSLPNHPSEVVDPEENYNGNLYEYYFKQLRERPQRLTIFKNSFNGGMGTFLKKPGVIKPVDSGNGVYTYTLSSAVIMCQILGKLKVQSSTFLHYDKPFESIKLFHNGIELYSFNALEWSLLQPIIYNNQQDLLDLIFTDQYVPFQTVKVEISVNNSQPTWTPPVIYYEAYQLSEVETKRFQDAMLEYYVCSWAIFNVTESDDNRNLTKPTKAYVADIICDTRGADKCEFYPEPGLIQSFSHWSSTPSSHWKTGTRLSNIDDMTISSLIPPNTVLFKEHTDEPVLVRYISVLRMMDGKTSFYADLYQENPKHVAKCEIKQRIKEYKEGKKISTRIIGPPPENPIFHGDVSIHDIRAHSYKTTEHGDIEIYVPTEWKDEPGLSDLALYEPCWKFLTLNQGKSKVTLIHKVVNSKHTEVHIYNGIDMSNPGNRLYYWRYNNKWYGVTDKDLEMYDLYVPINDELCEAMESLSVIHLMRDAEN